MLYHVSRNGQLYGPYTIEQLRSFILSGNVLPTDMAKTQTMPEWLPVQQILDGASAVSPGVSTASIDAYPDPPNLAWPLVALFNVLTCGVFMAIWNIVMSAWMRRVQPMSTALFYYIGGAVLTLTSSAPFFWMHHNYGYHAHHPFAGTLVLVGWVLRLIARFSMKADLERHYNGPEPLGLMMNPVLTFFFGGLYIQSQLTRINEIKRAIRFGSAVR